MAQIIQFVAAVIVIAAFGVFVYLNLRWRRRQEAPTRIGLPPHPRNVPGGVVPVLRNHVSFTVADPASRTWRGIHVLEDFADHLRCYPNEYRMTPIVQDGDEAYFSVCGFEDSFHRVVIRSTGRATGHWFVRHSFGPGLSETIDYWLKTSTRFADVRWYSEAEWDAMRPGQERPW